MSWPGETLGYIIKEWAADDFQTAGSDRPVRHPQRGLRGLLGGTSGTTEREDVLRQKAHELAARDPVRSA